MNSFSDDDLRNYLLGKMGDDERVSLESQLDDSTELANRLQALEADDQLTKLVGDATVAGQKEEYAHWVPSDGFSVWSTGAVIESQPAGSEPPGDEGTKDADQSARRQDARPPAWLRDHPRYEVHQLLGVGGMGRVWLARHKVMGRLVALKAMRSSLLSHRHAVERFLREVQAAGRLSHPNVAAAYDAEQIDDVYLLAMEYVPGRTLASVARSSPMSVRDACCAIRDAAAGLAHAHAAGMVHRDIKPGNLILTPSGVVKVLDFGLVVISDSDSSITGDNLVMGTPDYIAPEQAEDARKADARADLYSLGCTLYYLLTSHAPYAGASPIGKIDLHRTSKPARIPDIPAELNDLIEKLMQKDPGKRFQTAEEVAQAVEPWCRSPLEPVRQPLILSPRQPSRRGWIVAGIAGGLAVLELLRRQMGSPLDDKQKATADGVSATDASTTPSDANYTTREIALESLTETVEQGSPRAGFERDGALLRLDSADGGPQVWLDFVELDFTNVTLECRLKASLGPPFSFAKFAFLGGRGSEVNVQLVHRDGEPVKLLIAEWDPGESVLIEQDVDENFASEWKTLRIEMLDRSITVSINGVTTLSSTIKRSTSRKLAISSLSATMEVDQCNLTCRDLAVK